MTSADSASPGAGEAGWPAAESALSSGRALLVASRSKRVVIACDHDVDGLASALLVERAVERLGGAPVTVPIRRGEHLHVPAYRDRLAALGPSLVVATDMGSRAEPVGLSVPTLIIDHHTAAAFPPDAVMVSASGREPVAPTSLLAWVLVSALAPLDDVEWLALLGSAADLGREAKFGGLEQMARRHRATHVSQAIALLNAARRAPSHDVATALEVLRAAKSPADIALGKVPGVERLRELRAEVAAEVRRCARVPPRVHGDVAVIRIRSAAQIHPLLAARWRDRLAKQIVLVANDGFLPGRVNFVVRSARQIDLLQWLRSLGVEGLGDDFARGHPAATGGSVTPEGFRRLLEAIDRSSSAAPSAPGSSALH